MRASSGRASKCPQTGGLREQNIFHKSLTRGAFGWQEARSNGAPQRKVMDVASPLPVHFELLELEYPSLFVFPRVLAFFFHYKDLLVVNC